MKTIYKNCTLLDGTKDMKAQKNRSVAVENGIIVEIGTDIAVPDKAKVIDLDGRYLMPGLINLHVHLPAGGKPSKKQTDTNKLVKFVLSNPIAKRIGLKLCQSNAMTELLSGVTTIRAVGGIGNFDTVIRDKINLGKIDGPRILAANTAIGTPGGHMVGSVACAAESVSDCISKVNELNSQNVDLIKLMITGGVIDATEKGEPGVLKMPPEFVKACCDEAHRLGLKVAAHVESPQGVRVAVENGVDTVEHGATLDSETIELFKKNHSCLISTLSPCVPMMNFDLDVLRCNEMVRYNAEVVHNHCVAGTKTALENGIPVGIGTDTGCPFITHYNMWRELHYFKQDIGATPEFTLYSATLGNAEIAQIDNETGSIETGKSADMLITNENPLDDFRAIREPYMVVMRGRIFENPKIKKYAEVDVELDKYMEST